MKARMKFLDSNVSPSHRPLCHLSSATLRGDLRAALQKIAAESWGEVVAPFASDIAGETWRALDSACAEFNLRWQFSVTPTEKGNALFPVVRDVAAGGAAGVWASLQAEQNWVLARAVPLGERGAQWNRAVDLLEPRAANVLAGWNERARIFAFAQTARQDFAPSPEAAREVLAAIKGVVAALPQPQAWCGVRLEIASSETPAFPFSRGLEAQLGTDFGITLISLVADTGEAAVARRLRFWEIAHGLAAAEFWQLLRAACDQSRVQLNATIQAASPSHLSARWGDTLRRFVDVVSIVPGSTTSQTETALRWVASSCALSGVVPPHAVQAVLEDDSFLVGAARIECAEETTLSPSVVAARNTHWAARSAQLSMTSNAARVALLWPQNSLSAHYNPRAHRYVRWVEHDFERTTHFLETLHFDFLVVPDNEFETAQISVENDRTLLRCGEKQYPFEMVVLPSVTTLSRVAWQTLETFVAQGGKVVCLGLLPRWSERGRDAEFETQVNRATMLVVADIYDAYAKADAGAWQEPSPHERMEQEARGEISGVGYPVARSNETGGRLSCYQPRLNFDEADARLRVRGLLMDSLAPDLESQSAQLLCAHRTNSTGGLFLLHNRDARAGRINIRLHPTAEGAPYFAASGKAAPVREWMELTEIEGSGLVLPLELAAHETRVLLWQNGATEAHVERADFVVEDVNDDVVRGYATQNGTPTATWLETGPKGERLVSRRGEDVSVPAPMLLDDSEIDGDCLVLNATIPSNWQGLRVWLELTNVDSALHIEMGGDSRFLVAPPWKTEVSTLLRAGENSIRVVGANEETLARLVAYPSVEIQRR